MPKYFIDFEFIEDGHTIDPLSIGVVCEDGREYYAENLDVNICAANDWVKANVIPQLWSQQSDKHIGNNWYRDHGQTGGLIHKGYIAQDVRRFCDPDLHGKPVFWGYYADYDWVALCQLYGTMMDLPKGWPKYCRDIKQWADDLGNPKLPEQGKGEHHALADAVWNSEAYNFLYEYNNTRKAESNA